MPPRNAPARPEDEEGDGTEDSPCNGRVVGEEEEDEGNGETEEDEDEDDGDDDDDDDDDEEEELNDGNVECAYCSLGDIFRSLSHGYMRVPPT